MSTLVIFLILNIIMLSIGFENESERYCSTFNPLAKSFDINEFHTVLALAPTGAFQ